MTAPTIEEVVGMVRNGLWNKWSSHEECNAQCELVRAAILAYAAAQVRKRTEERDAATLFDGHAVFKALSPGAQRRTSAENVGDVLDAIVSIVRAKFLADEQPKEATNAPKPAAYDDTLHGQIAKAREDRATWPQWLDPDFRDRSAVPPKPGDGREEG